MIGQVIIAINKHPEIGKSEFPAEESLAKQYVESWAKLSGPSEMCGLLDHCIGAIDGIIIRTRAPTKKRLARFLIISPDRKNQSDLMYKQCVIQALYYFSFSQMSW